MDVSSIFSSFIVKPKLRSGMLALWDQIHWKDYFLNIYIYFLFIIQHILTSCLKWAHHLQSWVAQSWQKLFNTSLHCHFALPCLFFCSLSDSSLNTHTSTCEFNYDYSDLFSEYTRARPLQRSRQNPPPRSTGGFLRLWCTATPRHRGASLPPCLPAALHLSVSLTQGIDFTVKSLCKGNE